MEQIQPELYAKLFFIYSAYNNTKSLIDIVNETLESDSVEQSEFLHHLSNLIYDYAENTEKLYPDAKSVNIEIIKRMEIIDWRNEFKWYHFQR